MPRASGAPVSYEEFLKNKEIVAEAMGFDADIRGDHLFPFQRDLVRWACRRGRAAIFAGTGLGKTRMQLEWAKQVVGHTGERVLILAPLVVAEQTVDEGRGVGIPVEYARKGDGCEAPIVITNYEMRQHFDTDIFAGIVLDESSCIKDETSATRTELIESFAETPFRLCCTATPSPNDFAELGNHSEFLGIMRRTEMLSSFFVHDGETTQDWRLKGHARDAFWKWVSSWGAMVKSPSDLGYPNDGYELPPLWTIQHTVAATAEQARAQGRLFAEKARTLSDQRSARNASMNDRVSLAAGVIGEELHEPWLVWCELNAESEALTKAIPGALEITGAMSHEAKRTRLLAWLAGDFNVLVTKPSVAGFGLNAQRCARQMFVGVSHSFEQYFQAVRRCWRFGQTREVVVHLVVAELEGAVRDNLRRKEAEAEVQSEEMRKYPRDYVQANIRKATREQDPYDPKVKMKIPKWVRSSKDG